MHARRTRCAFTLVELIVVVVILGILAGIGLVSYQQVTKRAQDKSIETTVSSLAKEAQGLAAYRADGHFVAADLTSATGDLPPLPEAAATAAAWQIKAAPYSFVTAYGQLAIRLAADGTAAGVAAMSQSGNCLLTRITPTGAPTLRLVGPVGGSCSGDTALAAQPSDPVQWTDPSVAGPPAAPAGLASRLTGNTVTLTWAANTETDLAGYRITVDGVAQPELLSSPTATIPAVPGEHTVTVVAVDKSALSSDASAPLVAAVPPAGPAHVSASVAHGVVSISWTPAPGATSYRIWHQVGTSVATILGQVLAPATSITDTDLPAGASVTYSVAAANRGGESAATPAGAPITAPTAAPSGVTAAASGTSITVTWTAPAGAAGYRIYRDGATAPVWTGTGTSWADAGLTAGSAHTYVVTATNAGGESTPSAAAAATTAPSVPAGLVAAAGDGSTNLTWQATAAADGYRIYRSTDGATFTLLGQANDTNFTDSALVNGTSYWYAVAAFNGAGESGQSTAASSKPLPPVPAVPSDVTTSVTGTSVTVSWSAVSRADGYRVYKNGTLLAQITGSTSATDTLTAGGTADYSVSAYNLAGESAQSAGSTAAAQPAAPTGVTAAASGTTITVGWTAPTGATSFKVYRDGSATPAFTGTDTSWADTGLAAGSTHTYVVTATNAGGESDSSATASATVVPGTPAGLTATAGDNTVALSWSPTAGAAGYRLYRAPDATGTAGTFLMIAQQPGTSFSDATAVNGSTYWYAVSAFNPGGESGQSTAASSKPLPPVPAVPSGVTTSVTGTTVTISWNSVARADGYRVYKNGTLFGGQVIGSTSTTDILPIGTTATYTVSAYNLAGESGQSAGSTAAAQPAAPTGVTATPAGTAITVGWAAQPGVTSFKVYRDGSSTAAFTGTGTSWADTGLAAGSTHTYTVTATSAAGESDPSASATATLIPPMPTGLQVSSVSANPVVLTWNASAGATSYTVYRNGVTLATTGATGYTDSAVTGGVGYTYAVEAFNAGGGSGRTPTIGAVPGSAYAQTVLADNPASYWLLNDASGTTASNLAPAGAATSAAYTSGVTLAQGSGPIGYLASDQAAKFSGGWATMPSGSLSGTTQTLVAWFKTTTAGGVIVGYQDAPIGGTITQHVPALYVDNTGHLHGEFWQNATSNTAYPIGSAGTVNDGKWHMAVLAGAVNTQALYLDGNLVGTLAGTILPQNMTYAQIGNGYADTWPGAGANAFSGQIGQVAIFHSALSQAQVRALENASMSPYSQAVMADSPASYWRMNEAAGTTAGNLSSTGESRNASYTGSLTVGQAGPLGNDSTSKAATFSGGSMALPSNALTATTQTLVTWFKTTTAGGVIAGYQNNATPDSAPSFVPALYIDPTGHLRGAFWAGSGTGTVNSAGVVNDGKWHMAVLTAAVSTQSLYLDGTLVGTQSGTIQPLDMSYAQIGYGRNASWAGAGAEAFSGQIGEVAIFPSALSQAQVSALVAAAK